MSMSTLNCRFVVCVVVLIKLLMIKSIEINEDFPDERGALMQIRDIVNSSSNLHKNWTGPPCYYNRSRWMGIACTNWHITQLVLEGIQLTGSLPATFLQNITFLNKLSFRNNSIYGPLPNLANLVLLEFVFLSHNRFSGSIPFGYTKLPKLSKLELQNNSLVGSIPPFDQQTLTVFNVSFNQLDGLIPETYTLQKFPKSSYDHNFNLCGRVLEIPCPVSPPTPPSAPVPSPNGPNRSKKKNKWALEVWSLALIVAAAALLPFFVIFVFLCYYRRVHGKETGQQPGGHSGGRAEKKPCESESMEDSERTVQLQFIDNDRPVFDVDDLLRASAEVIGRGQLGTTYKAMLESGTVVAVKRIKQMIGLSKKEFVQQMQLLGNMRHEKLLEIISFYYSKEEKLIIYEFFPHSNLSDLLHENRGIGRVPLNWTIRLSIIKDITKGLTFLHQALPSSKVPHGNLNSSTILVHLNDQNHHSKLTEFGFLPLLSSHKFYEKLAVGQTPEFCQGKKLTFHSDVYCYGIVVLEVITGKIPAGEITQGNEGSVDDLSDWVRTVERNDWSTDVLDIEILLEKEGYDQMFKLIEIGLECTDMAPGKRPEMSEVLRRIEEI